MTIYTTKQVSKKHTLQLAWNCAYYIYLGNITIDDDENYNSEPVDGLPPLFGPFAELSRYLPQYRGKHNAINAFTQALKTAKKTAFDLFPHNAAPSWIEDNLKQRFDKIINRYLSNFTKRPRQDNDEPFKFTD